MKKVILSFAIVLSSFFIFNFKVKADINGNFSFNYIPEDFLAKKKAVDDYIKSNDTYGTNYVIFMRFENSKIDHYEVCIFKGTSSSVYYKSNSLNFIAYSRNCSKFENNTLGNFTSYTQTSYSIFSSGSYRWYIIYSSFDLKTSVADYTVTLTAEDYSKDFAFDGSNFPTIYDMYVEKNGELVPDNPHKEEQEILESFYSLCIEKLKYLGEVFISNYIYLTTFVVCILMFVFSLIVRRFL